MCFLPEIARDISAASDQGIQVAKRKRQKMLCFFVVGRVYRNSGQVETNQAV